MKKVDRFLAAFAAAVILFGIIQAVNIARTKAQMRELAEDVSEVAQERQRLSEQAERQETPERPAVAVVAEVPEAPVFEPLDVPLAPYLQHHTYDISVAYGIPYDVLLAIMEHESGFQVDAVGYNHNGTYDSGLCQINSINHGWLLEDHQLDVTIPEDNIEAAAVILTRFLEDYSLEQALAAYAAGEAGMQSGGGVCFADEIMMEVYQ